ncbi:MAG: DNA internalization-related competence protein ComEC/Rec2 [Magnetococcales bacterium]|nr:DNA internalization-related competence protein ComEC/Rec2 [Magnetococcales bacterium]
MVSGKALANPPDRPVANPALFLAWMLIGLIALLPDLASQRAELLAIAAIPALAACRSRWTAGANPWPLALAGLLWGLCVVRLQPLVTPNLPEALSGAKTVLQAVVADREDRDDSTLLLLDQVSAGEWHASGKVRVTFNKKNPKVPLPDVLPGDRIEVPARLHQLASFRNPGGFDYRAYLLEQGVIASGSATGPAVWIAATGEWQWNRWRQQISEWLAATLPASRLGLAEALLVGKRGHIDASLQEALFVSGTYHLISISGLHLSLVGGSLFFLFRLALVTILPLARRWDMKRPAALLTFIPLTAYAQLAGWTVPVQRSFIMVGLFLLAVAWQRRRQSWRVLTFSAIAVLTWQPGQLTNAGCQLSFLCVAVILYLIDLFPARTWWEKVLWSLGSTLAVELVTAPIALYSFHRLSPYGILANPVAIPLVGELSTPLGLLALVIRPFWPQGADGLLLAMGWTLEWYRWLIEWTATLPGAWSRFSGPPLPGVALYLAAGWVALALRRPGPWHWKRAMLLGMAVAALWWPKDFRAEALLRLIVLDVGQALSMVVKMPHGGWMVVDSGGVVSSRFNIGEGVTSTALWHYGVERLERVVVSHPQRDHMSGVAAILRNFPVGGLWMARVTTEEMLDHSVHGLLLAAQQERVPVRFFDAPARFTDGKGEILVLPPMPEGNKAKLNDRSLVVELRHGKHRFLLTGDMESREESWLLAQNALAPVTMALVPHHGSLTSSTPAFVGMVRPEHAVVSVGRDNPWGFPKEAVTRRWEAVGARLWRTDRDGAVMFASDGETLTITTGE